MQKKKEKKHKRSQAFKQVNQLQKNKKRTTHTSITTVWYTWRDLNIETHSLVSFIAHLSRERTASTKCQLLVKHVINRESREQQERMTDGGDSTLQLFKSKVPPHSPLNCQLLPSSWQQGDCMKQIMRERREVQKADYSPSWEESPTGQEEERQREKLDQFSEQS